LHVGLLTSPKERSDVQESLDTTGEA